MNNKKNLIKNILFMLTFHLSAAGVFIAKAMTVHAQSCGPIVGIYCNPVESKVSNFVDVLIIIILYLLSLVGTVALLFIIISGIKYMTSAGDEEKMKSAKSSFNAAVLGLIIAIMAYGILSVINGILNG